MLRAWDRVKKKGALSILPDTSFSLCFLNGRSAYWTESKWLTFQPGRLRALSFDGRSSFFIWAQHLIAAGISQLLSRPLFDGSAHLETPPKKKSKVRTRRHSLAHSGCCCPLGLCSGPAAAASLCLCCRWCASSLGYPSSCWRGTSLLFPLPGKLEKRKKSSSQLQM